MDHEKFSTFRDEHNDFEQVPGSIRADDQPAIRFVPCVLDNQRIVNGMENLLISNAMPAS